MSHLRHPAWFVLRHPLAFAARVLAAFRANQGLLLAGAVAYYALLSLIPLLILVAIGLSHRYEPAELAAAIGKSIEWLVPSQSQALMRDVHDFVENRHTLGAILLPTLLFFSSLTFSVLGKSLAVIFDHRHAAAPRRPLGALVPYGFAISLGVALLAISVSTIALQSAADEQVHALGREWSLRGPSGALLYLLALGTELVLLTLAYLVLPPGRTRLSHALFGAATITLVWDLLRRGLVWYFTSISRVGVVYGSLTTAVVAMFCMEIVATLLLLGAQVIASYEQLAAQARADDAPSGSK